MPDVEREPSHRADPEPLPTPILPPWIVIVVVLVALGLLVAVVVVGLKRDSLDSTGVATVLGTLISGVVVGLLFKGKGGGES